MTLEQTAKYAPWIYWGAMAVCVGVGVAVAEFALSHSKPRRHKERA